MKRRRTIVIKDPRLQKIRNNLRTLWLRWGRRQWSQLQNECNKIEFDENNKLRDLSNKERERVRDLRAKMREIDHIRNHSICKCSTCSKADKDMFYNPYSAEWFCIECVSNYCEAYYKYQEDISQKPWDVDEDEMEFLKSFTYSGILEKPLV